MFNFAWWVQFNFLNFNINWSIHNTQAKNQNDHLTYLYKTVLLVIIIIAYFLALSL